MYYYFNEETQEASWDAPATEKPTTTEENGNGAQGEGGDGGAGGVSAISHEGHGSDVGSGQNQPLVVPPFANSTSAADNTESQFPFYVNERGNRVFCVPRRM